MLSIFTPDLQIDSALELMPAQLRTLGIEALLLDVDCTLKDYCETSFRPEVIAWIQLLRHANFRLCLVSNGGGRRIKALADDLKLEFVAQALKPFPFGCSRALRKLKSKAKRTALVGDQIFADVLAGKLAGVRTILVKPTTTVEPWFTRLKRPMERRVLRWIAAASTRAATRRPKDPSRPELPRLASRSQ